MDGKRILLAQPRFQVLAGLNLEEPLPACDTVDGIFSPLAAFAVEDFVVRRRVAPESALEDLLRFRVHRQRTFVQNGRFLTYRRSAFVPCGRTHGRGLATGRTTA